MSTNLIDNKEINENDKVIENSIIAKIKIEKGNLNQIIINSYENVLKEMSFIFDKLEIKKNEEEIKNCEIYINGKKINFNYYYDFPNEGEYTIKYKFNNLLTSTSFLFYNCHKITSFDLSNFNTENIIEMVYMFYDCNSLKE